MAEQLPDPLRERVEEALAVAYIHVERWAVDAVIESLGLEQVGWYDDYKPQLYPRSSAEGAVYAPVYVLGDRDG